MNETSTIYKFKNYFTIIHCDDSIVIRERGEIFFIFKELNIKKKMNVYMFLFF